MNINIPDKLYKLIILVGALLIVFGSYKIETSEENYFGELDKYRTLRDSINILTLKIEKKKNDLVNISDNLSNTYDVENPISQNDSTIFFQRIITGTQNKLTVSDSIQKLWVDYKNSTFQLDLLDKKLSFADGYLEEEKQLKESYLNSFVEIRDIGFILFFLGCFAWLIDTEVDPKKRIKQFEKVYTFCQSCSRDFSSMRTYGSNNDDSFNYAFCSECYNKGQFTEPNLTKIQAKERFMKNLKIKNWFINLLAKIQFAKTERWM